MANGLYIKALGGLSIRLDGQPVSDLASRKAEALLVYLACNPRAHPREVLADLLWDDRGQRQAMANLRVVLSSLRKELGPFVHISRTMAGVYPESGFWLDAGQLEQAATAVQERGRIRAAADAQRLAEALALYEGDFLVGFFLSEAAGFESWAAAERERLHRLALDALGRLSRWHLEQGDYPAASATATRLVGIAPLAEVGQRQLMEALARSGRRAEALRQYELYARLLDEEMGLEPPAGIRELCQAIAAGQLAPSPALQERYRLQDRIGSGAMGDVYRAIDTQTVDTVAVKTLDPALLRGEPGLLERFQREGEALLRGLKWANDAGWRSDYPRAIYGLAEVANASGRKEEAVELAALVHNHDVTPHEIKLDAAELLKALEADLPPDVYEAAYARGTSLDLDEVAQQLLEEGTVPQSLRVTDLAWLIQPWVWLSGIYCGIVCTTLG